MKEKLQKYVSELKHTYDFHTKIDDEYNRGSASAIITIIGDLIKRFDLENPFIKELEEENK